MRIAQLAPLTEAVPPVRYGGTERVVHNLTEELVRRGHQVTLFASGDSRTSAQLVPVCPRALRLDPWVEDPVAFMALELGMAFERADEFDLIHSHLDYFTLPFARMSRTPTVLTLHGRLDLPDFQPIFAHYREVPLISVSNNQRRPMPEANWLATVYHGVPVQDFAFHPHPGDYLAFLGRIAPEKGVEKAIEVARRAGWPLKIAAKIDPKDRDYYEQRVRPLMASDHVEYVGELSEAEKSEFLGRAAALIFPIHWPEPFGLVMVEALASGTPVIAGRCGSVPEILVHGETGFICDSVEEMVLFCNRLDQIDRYACRRAAEARFSVATMANGYEAAYRKLLVEHQAGRYVRAA